MDRIYTELVIPKNSGTEENPIIFKAASGVKSVIIAGSDPAPVSKWENLDQIITPCLREKCEKDDY